jgi:TolB-like protein
MEQCPSCGADRARPGVACPACGHSFADSAPTSAPPTSQPPISGAATSDAPTSGGSGAVAQPIPAQPLQLGAVLGGRYRLESLLGRGGMGEVYRAQDLKLGQAVALKFLPATVANNASAMQRFLSEMRLGRQVSHANVCRLHDLVEIDGRYALSMEFIDGEDLATRIARSGPLAAAELRVLAQDLCAGLAAAHERGVVHRDLKPANVLLDRAGRAHVADFGIAALAADVDARESAGTLAYMAPELLAGAAASVRSDLYSLGLVLYEAARGRRRFSARSLEELKAQQALPPERRGRAPLPGAPADVRRLVAACLKVSPKSRPVDAAAAASMLRSESWLPKPRQLALAAALVLLVFGGLGWLGWQRGLIVAGPRAGAVARLGPASAAVLPFANLSGRPGDEYFSDGMSDTLIDRLSQVPQLRMAARTSSFAFKGKSATVQDIGAALGVAALVEGSVQRQGDLLRINAELVRVADGTHLWSQHYDRNAADLFAIQDEIASAVTTALVGKLLPSSRKALARRGTRDLQAYRDYLQGHQAMNRVSMDAFQRAEQHLAAALERDPRYLDAMLDLVQCWGWQHHQGAFDADEFQRRAGPMLDRADGLDPGNARVLALRGWLAMSRNDDALAIALVDRAVALSPDDYGIRINAAGAYGHSGDRAGELRHQDRMVELDPLNPFGHAQRGMTLEQMGRLDEAQAAARRALKLDPDDIIALAVMANVALDRHDNVGALTWAFRIYPHNADPSLAIDLATNLDAIGEPAAAEAWLQRSRRLQPQNNIIADQFEIQRLLAAGKNQAAFVATKKRLQWGGASWNHRGDEMLWLGCLAAARVGKLEDMRAALVRASLLPAVFDASHLRAWAGNGAEGLAQLTLLNAYGVCAFSARPEDAPRRDALRQAFAALSPAGEANGHETLLEARLRNDREAIATILAGEPANAAWFKLARAEMGGVADDPRVQAQIRRALDDQARTHAQLPGALAKAGLSMWPPPEAKAATAP